MNNSSLPASAAAWLEARGERDAAADGTRNLPALVRAFRDTMPPEDDPLSDENLRFLTALLDCLEVMDERLYEHYRAVIDLFRTGVFHAPREQLLRRPGWTELRARGVRKGFLPEELYGASPALPRICVPEAYLRLKEVSA